MLFCFAQFWRGWWWVSDVQESDLSVVTVGGTVGTVHTWEPHLSDSHCTWVCKKPTNRRHITTHAAFMSFTFTKKPALYCIVVLQLHPNQSQNIYKTLSEPIDRSNIQYQSSLLTPSVTGWLVVSWSFLLLRAENEEALLFMNMEHTWIVNTKLSLLFWIRDCAVLLR